MNSSRSRFPRSKIFTQLLNGCFSIDDFAFSRLLQSCRNLLLQFTCMGSDESLLRAQDFEAMAQNILGSLEGATLKLLDYQLFLFRRQCYCHILIVTVASPSAQPSFNLISIGSIALVEKPNDA